MTRPLTEAMAQALAAGYARGLFVSIDHPSGTGYFCTGLRSRQWGGHTWNAVGLLGSVTPIKQSSDIAIQDIEFVLSGVDSAIVAQIGDNVRNRVGTIWLACFGPDDAVIADPYQLQSSELDYQTFEIAADGTATITITAHAGFYTLDRALEGAWTPENQRLAFPTDTGLDLIPSLQHQDLQWTPS